MKFLPASTAILLTVLALTSAADPLLQDRDLLLRQYDPLLGKPPVQSEEKTEKVEEKRVVHQLGVMLLMKSNRGPAVLMGEADGFYPHFTPFESIEEGGDVFTIPMLGLPTDRSSALEEGMYTAAKNIVSRKTAGSINLKESDFIGNPTVYSKAQSTLFYLLRDDSMNAGVISRAVNRSRNNRNLSREDREFVLFHVVPISSVLKAARCAKNSGYPSIASTNCYRLVLDRRYFLLDKYYIDAIARDYKNAKEGFEGIFNTKEKGSTISITHINREALKK